MVKKNIFKTIISSIVFVLTILLLVGCSGKKQVRPTEAPINSTEENNNTNNNNNNNNNNHFLSTARSIKVVQIDGKATVTDDEETVKCFPGMNLYDGDTLTVSKDSTLIVKFDEDKYVYLGENTTIVIKSEGKDKYKTNIFVTNGTVLAEVQKKLDDEEEFFLSSNNSVMAVRGTIFGLNVKNVGSSYLQTYAVYRGVTELFVFDKVEGNIISGKISDISNAKYEITIPKSHVISEDEKSTIIGEWLDKTTSTFDDAEDANNQLDLVEIAVSKPTKDDFDEVLNITEENNNSNNNNDPVTYSDIEYTSRGYFGEFDGTAHMVEITPTTAGATVKYSLDGVNYQDNNDFEFYAPGKYRVYYKIECEGYNTKEDFEVIYITKPSIIVESDCITYDSISKASILSIATLEPEDFNRYNGVAANKVLANRKFYLSNSLLDENNVNVTINYNKLINGYIELVDGKNTLNVSFEFTDYTINTEVDFLFSDTREDSGYAIGISDTNIEQLSGNVYYINNEASYLTSVGVGAYEVDGDDFLSVFGLDVLDLSTMLINYPSDVKGDDTAEYDGRTTITLEDVSYGYEKINFLVFPTATTKGFDATIYITVKADKPESGEYAVYSINKTSYAYNPTKNPSGVKMNFVTSEQPVKYSLDGTDFQTDLYLTESGSHKVYYKVIVNENYEAFNIVGYEFIDITAGEGEITFDNKMFITNPVHILSNDNGNSLDWTYTHENYTYNGTVEATNNSVITSLDDVYTVYTNMIINASFYDSITNEAIEAVVTVSAKKANSANFNYTIEADGYETLSGTVRFDYSQFGELTNINVLDNHPAEDYISVTLPNDYEISLSDVPQAVASRISVSIEDDFINYETYYSKDNGKTWTKDAPVISEAGEYDIYVLYCLVDSGNDATTLVDGEVTNVRHCDLSANGNFIIDIEHITITD